MTAQIGEKIIFKGEETWMASEPLHQYLQTKGDIHFFGFSSDNRRGYSGKWEIKNKKLYLIDLKPFDDRIFKGKKEVFADWFSGEIRIPQGKMLEYIHMGYKSIYEKDLILTFKEGILIDEKEIDDHDYLDNRQEKIQQYLKLFDK